MGEGQWNVGTKLTEIQVLVAVRVPQLQKAWHFLSLIEESEGVL